MSLPISLSAGCPGRSVVRPLHHHLPIAAAIALGSPRVVRRMRTAGLLPKRSRPSLYACCGRLACINTVNFTAELARRHPPRACAGCGVVFIPARKDNRHCLPACRSRAYRQRQLMIPPLPRSLSSTAAARTAPAPIAPDRAADGLADGHGPTRVCPLLSLPSGRPRAVAERCLSAPLRSCRRAGSHQDRRHTRR